MAQSGQDPLPLNSPHPDLVVPKQKEEDEGYDDTASPRPEPKVELGQVKNKNPPKMSMCKEANSALASLSMPTEAPPAEFMNPPPNMFPGVSGLPMSGNFPPPIMPLSEMRGPSPRPFRQDMPPFDGNPNNCQDCDVSQRRLVEAQRDVQQQLDDLERIRQQRMIAEQKRNRGLKIVQYMFENAQLNDGSQDMDAVLRAFFAKEAEERSNVEHEKKDQDDERFFGHGSG